MGKGAGYASLFGERIGGVNFCKELSTRLTTFLGQK